MLCRYGINTQYNIINANRTQFSSVGALSEKWLFDELKQSLSGSANNNNTASQKNENKEEKSKKKKKSANNNDDMQLMWPTVDYVKVRPKIF